ncbi:reverse transcriptase domain-containing protein [Thalassospiraceae bacterium LMO-SO8]|nr:hypothetical protein [Alphaproteobacteria bacterium LMO-S08]WND77884.1 reverse transcriptase domain-containing protein [Thalassospiraceae bacterium LMO-SO8]
MSTKQWNEKQYQVAKTAEAELWRKLRSACESGKLKRADYLTQLYFKSHHVKYFHAVEAFRNLKPHKKSKDIDLSYLADTVNVHKASTEPVVFDIKSKNSGHDYRHVKDYGIENRTKQGIVLAVLKARTHLHPNQFANVGGKNDAAKLVVQYLSAGFGWCVELDINDCFPSVCVEALSGYLPIPGTVIKHVLTCEESCAIPGSTLMNLVDPEGDLSLMTEEPDLLAETLKEGRQGIPQGSTVSSYVFELLLAPVFEDVPEGVRLVGYSDNILVMGRTEDDAVSMLFSLGAALKKHPAGPFTSKCGKITSPSQKFEFLGYEFQACPNGTTLVPSGQNRAEFQHKFDKGIGRIAKAGMTKERRKKEKENLRRYVRGWCAAFGLWDKAEPFKENRMRDIGDACVEAAG